MTTLCHNLLRISFLALLISLSGVLHGEDEQPDLGSTSLTDLSSYLLQDDVFSQSPESFLTWAEQAGAGFSWLSDQKMAARSIAPALHFGRLPLMETIARFEEASLARVETAIYTRGDAPRAFLMLQKLYEINKEAAENRLFPELNLRSPPDSDMFDRMIEKSVAHLSELLGAQPQRTVERAGYATTIRYTWNTPQVAAQLACAASGRKNSRQDPFQAEFLHLTLIPPREEKGLLEAALAEHDAGRASTKVEKEPVKLDNGDVLLQGIPMVDQGMKGYCVVASAERVLRWYGRDVDQHMLAQIAESSAAMGTSLAAMEEALSDLAQRFRVRTKDHYTMDIAEIRELVSDYNRKARRHDNALQITLGGLIDVNALFHSMNPEVLREVRGGSRSDVGRFERDVHREIDDGVPLLWAVFVGIVEEDPKLPQGFGGHMRLIIGYNEKTDEILYTDSWGPGHELKRMKVEDAWTISSGLYALESF